MTAACGKTEVEIVIVQHKKDIMALITYKYSNYIYLRQKHKIPEEQRMLYVRNLINVETHHVCIKYYHFNMIK